MKNRLIINENQIRNIVKKCLYNILNEDDSIHIDKNNEGKFTATKKRLDKSTEELTHSKNPITRKRAIFAKNAKHWNHKHKRD